MPMRKTYLHGGWSSASKHSDSPPPPPPPSSSVELRRSYRLATSSSSSSSSSVELRRRYRQLAFLVHPDKCESTNASVAFRVLREIYRRALDLLPGRGSSRGAQAGSSSSRQQEEEEEYEERPPREMKLSCSACKLPYIYTLKCLGNETFFLCVCQDFVSTRSTSDYENEDDFLCSYCCDPRLILLHCPKCYFRFLVPMDLP